MQVTNNVNTMNQLEKKLDESAQSIAKLNVSNNNPVTSVDKGKKSVDLVQEITEQIGIPLSYTANAQVITTQDSMSRTILDIVV